LAKSSAIVLSTHQPEPQSGNETGAAVQQWIGFVKIVNRQRALSPVNVAVSALAATVFSVIAVADGRQLSMLIPVIQDFREDSEFESWTSLLMQKKPLMMLVSS
jgi:hypothetical protein